MKRLMALTLSTLSVLSYAQIPDYVPTDGLIAFYPLGGNGLDQSLNSNHCQEVNATYSHDRYGVENGCLAIQSGNSFVKTPAFSAIAGTQSRTISFWIKRQTVTGGASHFVNAIGVRESTNFGTAFGCGFDSFGEEGVVIDVEDGALVYGHSNAFTEGDWNHYVFVLTSSGSPSKHDVSIYENAILITEIILDIAGNPGINTLVGGYTVGANPGFSLGQNIFDVQSPEPVFMDDIGFWNRALDESEIMSVYSAQAPLWGCTNTEACNFDALANADDGSCHFNCQYCHDGTIWDEELFKCVVANPADTNFDGCVQLNDLLDVLSAYGDCSVEESPWACGDPLSYQGYDYATVQIGDQCWFAENLQANEFSNGSEVPLGSAVPFGNSVANIDAYGLMYDGTVVIDEGAICPAGWMVSSLSDWQELISFVAANGYSSNESKALRSIDGWSEHGAGWDAFGFNGKPGGFHYNPTHPYWGEFAHSTESGYWWTTTPSGPENLHAVTLQGNYIEPSYPTTNGMSIRCIKDSE